MVIISGCLVVKDNKILMVKEAKKKCYGQWNFPAGHVEDNETLMEAAIREVYEETGCKVKLTGVLPIISVKMDDGEVRLMVRFVADIVEENIKFNEEEILDVQWLDIDEVKNMTEKELRGYEANSNFIKYFEEKRIYNIDVFDSTEYNG